ncbi:putative quinol monooxygenase [Geodermatophilus sp. URMC 64]
MLVVHVHVRVRPEHLEAFLEESRRNASASLQEPGVRRFDVLRDEADAGHVVLNEVYVDQSAADAHKQTAHYARWRDAVAGMMAAPRTSARFTTAFPGDDGW